MYDTILLPTDGSEATTDAAAHAFSHAAEYEASVHVLSVVELSGSLGTAGRDDEKLDRKREDRIEAAKQLVEQTAPDGIDVTIAVETGSPARVISEYAASVTAGLIVMSTRARDGAKRVVFGSVTEQVIQSGEAPVLAVQR